ncbi:CoA transferase [Nocardia rhizosphaerae]|uniref:CoA transferase n=1 Tax=Nocardia rhizosphaerae TaxID=1691571 RepID=A0ABV8LCF2_9NOCA
MTTPRQLVHAYESGLGFPPSASADEPDPGARLAATLPVWALAAGSVATVARAANRFRVAAGLPTAPVRLDPARIAAAFGSERLFLRDGHAPDIFAELSGFFRTADGWIRTHANYPHHRDRLAAAVGLPVDASAAAAAALFARLTAAEVEELAAGHDAIAVRVRTEQEWTSSAPGRAAAVGPLVAIDPPAAVFETTAAEAVRPLARPVGAGSTVDGASGGGDQQGFAVDSGQGPVPDTASRGTPSHPRWHTSGRANGIRHSARQPLTTERPLLGIRVLDLTRVLAGPVATRTLALLGADVLRVDPPWLSEIDWQFRDTCQGKRSTLLDLRTDPAVFAALLAEADVLVTGYRPGALAAAGVDTADHPGLIHARVSAWGETGPWGARRGFDSIVQAASGIALIEGTTDRPGALPAQALDHGSGYLLAAGVIDALRLGAEDGRGREVRVALARTASWLLAAGARTPNHPSATAPDPAVTVRHGDTRTAAPAFPDHPDYPHPAPAYGSAVPDWPDH